MQEHKELMDQLALASAQEAGFCHLVGSSAQTGGCCHLSLNVQAVLGKVMPSGLQSSRDGV